VERSADLKLRVAAARADFLSGGDAEVEGVPDLVAASWRRSASAGVPAGSLDLQYFDDLDVTSRLVRCAEPVIRRLTDETSDLALSIALTDSKARVLSRTDTTRTIGLLLDKVSLVSGFGYAEDRAGTNGIGTVLESGASVHIVGPEHFSEAFQPFSCTGAPIRDPLTGRVEGVLDVSCLTEHSSPIMHSLVRSAAGQIEQSLLLDRSQCQQALFDTYLRVDAKSRAAVMAVGESLVMMNAAAQLLLEPVDQAMLQEHTRFLMARQDTSDDRVPLTHGNSVRIRGTRIMVGADIAGMVLVITPLPAGDVGRPASFEDTVLVPQAFSTWPRRDELTSRLRSPRHPSSEGRTPAWRNGVQSMQEALAAREALLVMGETGCGKFTLLTELFHAIHEGGRSLSFDASAISTGSYPDAETALAATAGPTMYVVRNLDELTTDGVERLGALMLSVLDANPPVSIAATLSDVHPGAGLPFDELLPYFQTAVTLPSLRHRTADHAELVRHLLADLAPHRDVRVSPGAMRVISRYTWPRNIDQLKEALSSALARRPVGEIEEQDLPGYCHTMSHRALTVIEQAERDAIVTAIRDAHGNRVHAAKALGLARSSLYRKLKQYGITTI
jgi:transcriptional regulator of acetoin/glycerol metabolism